MSGIAGIYYLNNQPVCSENLVRVSDRLAHRGPDGTNIWTEDSIGFIHRMSLLGCAHPQHRHAGAGADRA